jgi:hypothetical protein
MHTRSGWRISAKMWEMQGKPTDTTWLQLWNFHLPGRKLPFVIFYELIDKGKYIISETIYKHLIIIVWCQKFQQYNYNANAEP